MAYGLPLILVPGLLCSARLYTAQIVALWPRGQVSIADHKRDSDMAEIAKRVLANAPPRFALAGLSMGGYIALAMMRLAPERIDRLALLDTSARPDSPEQKSGREKFIAMAEVGKISEVAETLLPHFIHRNRINDEALKSGARYGRRYRRGIFRAPDQGDHVARRFTAAAQGNPLPDLGAGGRGRRTDAAGIIEGNRRRHCRRQVDGGAGLRASVDDGKAGRGERGAGRMAGGQVNKSDVLALQIR